MFWAARAVSAELIERLAADLRASFPGALGLSRRGLQYMRAFAEAWPEEVQQAAAQLPWSHIMVLLDRLDDHTVREWYATRDAAEGWSRAVVETMVASWLHLRQGPAPSNFPATLPDADSDLVQEITRGLVSPHRYLRAGHRGCHQPPQLCHRPGCRSTSPSPVWTVLPVGFELVVGACQCPAATVRSHACSA